VLKNGCARKSRAPPHEKRRLSAGERGVYFLADYQGGYPMTHELQTTAEQGNAPPADTPRPGKKTNRRAPGRVCPISESIVISRFWRNRRGEAIVTSLEPFEARVVVHVRQYFTTTDGKLAPTKKGVAIDILRLPELAAAVAKALSVAKDLGLIPDNGAGR
jgi:hypothetical protein